MESFWAGGGHAIAHAPQMRWLTLMLFVAGCSQPKLQQVDGRSAVSPEAIAVTTFVGFPVERAVQVSNAGRSGLAVTVSATPGLVLLGNPQLQVASGQTVSVRVRVPAQTPALLHEALQLTVDGERVEVPVTAEILAVPACAEAGPCHEARFDPVTGACVEEQRSNGAACEGVCLQEASCQAGVCVGQPKSCDDANKCTRDTCAADGACAHADVSAQCEVAEADVGCQAGACDPALGCVLSNVVDGVACGANDCKTAKVCMAGVCQTVTPPEGSSCSAATPCRTEGKCVAQGCVATATLATASWELLDTPKVRRTLLGVVSPAGLIYGVERHDVGIFVVAWDRGGFERWRSPLYSEYWSTAALYDIDRTQLIVTSKTWVRAFDGATGAQKWFVELAGEIPLGNATPTGAKQVYPMKLAMLPAAKRVVASFSEGYEAHAIWVFGLDAATGQQAFKLRRDGHLYGLMTTANDGLFLGSAGCWAAASWNATYDAAGLQGWNLFQPGIPALTLGSHVYFQPYGNPSNFVGRIDLATGVMKQEGINANKAILADGSRLYATSTLNSGRLTAWDTAAQSELWTFQGLPLEQTFLTEGRGVLGLSREYLAHVQADGRLDWGCGMKLPLSNSWSASVIDGLLVVQTAAGLGAIPIGKLKVSATGWSVSERGNPQRTSRAR